VDVDQDTNTIQGTIGKGVSGVGEEVQRVKERLQAPDHLDEKEKMIFKKLDGALEPTKLEVCYISLSSGALGLGAILGIKYAIECSDRRIENRFKISQVDAAPCTGSRL